MKFSPQSVYRSAGAAVLLCMVAVSSFAQWTTTGNHIYNSNTGTVAIGTTTPTSTYKFELYGTGTSDNVMAIKNNTSATLSILAANDAASSWASFGSYRSRGTISAPTNVVGNERIGGLNGYLYFGGAYRSTASINMWVGSSPSSTSYPSMIQFNTTASGSTSAVERMRITDAGNVGIGLVTPGAKLEVSGTTRITTNGSNQLQVGAFSSSSDNFGYISSKGQTNGTGLKFETTNGSGVNTGAVRMTITNAGKVGIGTTTPGASYMLDVNGAINATGLYVNGQVAGGSSQWSSSGSNIYYNQAGSVGIGTATPNATYKLDVNGSMTSTGLAVNGISRIVSGTTYNYLQVGAYHTTTDNFGYVSSGGQTNGTGLKFETTQGSGSALGATRMTILNNGRVGIGTTNPDAELAVKGTVHAKEVRIDLTGWPDYVFDKDYNLLSLEDIRAYIEKHHHLPDVPATSDMEKNGINVSEMNMILLRKVEELTLHIINLKKEIELLKKEGNK